MGLSCEWSNLFIHMCADGVENIMNEAALSNADRVASWLLAWVQFWCCFLSLSYMCMHGENRPHSFKIFPQNKVVSLPVFFLFYFNNINNIHSYYYGKQCRNHWFHEREASPAIWSHICMDQILTLLSEPFLNFPHGTHWKSFQGSAKQGYPTFHQAEEREKERELETPWSFFVPGCFWSCCVCNAVRVSGDSPTVSMPSRKVVAVTWLRAETTSRGVKNNLLWLKPLKERI